MKQTPIPEKIKQWVEEDAGHRAFHPTEEELVKSINSLIDVLTEQQKEITDMEEHLDSIEKSLIRLNKDVWRQSYTAMRSTGEFIPNFTRTEIKPHNDCQCCCHKPEHSCDRDTWDCEHCQSKPQEDVTYTKEAMAIQKLIWERFYSVVTKEQAMEIADRILAIVKGE